MNASYKKINNLVMLVDYNKLQIDGTVCDVNDISSINDKIRAFGWNVINVANGHDCDLLGTALSEAKISTDKPTAIICHTVKGKGIVWAETEWNHHIEVSRDAADIAIAAFNA